MESENWLETPKEEFSSTEITPVIGGEEISLFPGISEDIMREEEFTDTEAKKELLRELIAGYYRRMKPGSFPLSTEGYKYLLTEAVERALEKGVSESEVRRIRKLAMILAGKSKVQEETLDQEGTPKPFYYGSKKGYSWNIT